MSELDTYVSAACQSLALGVPEPHNAQIHGIFKQLVGIGGILCHKAPGT